VDGGDTMVVEAAAAGDIDQVVEAVEAPAEVDLAVAGSGSADHEVRAAQAETDATTPADVEVPADAVQADLAAPADAAARVDSAAQTEPAAPAELAARAGAAATPVDAAIPVAGAAPQEAADVLVADAPVADASVADAPVADSSMADSPVADAPPPDAPGPSAPPTGRPLDRPHQVPRGVTNVPRGLFRNPSRPPTDPSLAKSRTKPDLASTAPAASTAPSTAPPLASSPSTTASMVDSPTASTSTAPPSTIPLAPPVPVDTVVDTVPDMPDFVVPSPTAGAASFASAPPGPPPAAVSVTSAAPRSHPLVSTLVSVVGAVAIALACVGVGNAFFSAHVNPGVVLAGHDLTGFSASQVRDVAVTMIDNYAITLELGGRQVQATPDELGMTFDLDQTVADVMRAGDADLWQLRLNPFQAKSVPLAISVNQATLQTFLNRHFIADAQRSVPADATYDAEADTFAIIPAKNGTQADAARVAQALQAGQGYTAALTVPTIIEAPSISDIAAQQAVDQANQLLATPYVVRADDRTYTVPADQIGSWVSFTPDSDAGTVGFVLDTERAKAELPGLLSTGLSVPAVPQQNMIGPDGQYLGVQQWGEDGISLTDPTAAGNAVAEALSARTGIDLAASTQDQDFGVEDVAMPEQYLSPGGARWVEVNLSNYTVTRWEGTSRLSTWSVVIGLSDTPTYPGIFHVYAMLSTQTMTGEGYVQPDVPWIAYFDRDIALHGNYWVKNFGRPASHGCVGMPVDLAKVMYDWLYVDDMVVVHY
jgi:hypothetical protein